MQEIHYEMLYETLDRIAIALEEMNKHQEAMSRIQAQILVQGEKVLELSIRGVTAQERTAAIYEMVTLTKRNEEPNKGE